MWQCSGLCLLLLCALVFIRLVSQVVLSCFLVSVSGVYVFMLVGVPFSFSHCPLCPSCLYMKLAVQI